MFLCCIVYYSVRLHLEKNTVLLQMSQEGRNTPPPSTSRTTSRMPSPRLSLSPPRSPIDSGSHAEWMEAQLLRDMWIPQDKWKVAVAQAPKIPRRSPPMSEPDGTVASTSANQVISAPTTGVRSDSSSTGKSRAILYALLTEFEPSGGVEREERGWSETLSHEAMEELNQWL